MKTPFSCRLLPLGLTILVCAVFTVIEANATVTVGLANPAWSQTLACKAPFGPTTCPRFVKVMGGAAVLDEETGLVWEHSPDDTYLYDWDFAQTHCNQLTTGGRLGWRLPTIQELASLVDPTRSSPSLPAGHPFSNVQSSGYWSATTYASNADLAWGVSFGDGGVFDDFFKGDDAYVWCVRGGSGVDAQ